MQALNVSFGRSTNDTNSIAKNLWDILTNITVEPSFRITHPQYQPTETPEDVVAKLQQMLPDVQHKYLTLQLRNFLQGIYYRGNWQKADALANDKLENLGDVEANLFYKLNECNHGKGYLDNDWLVTGEENNLIALYKDELTLHVEPDRYLLPEYQTPKQGDFIPVKCPNHLVEYGYYVAVGNAGAAYTRNPEETVNVYFNFSAAEGAILFTSLLTEQLNALELPFTFKCLYTPSEYDRYDAGILNIESDRYLEVKKILDTLYLKHQIHFSPEIPLFTKFLAPGIGLAEEPEFKDSPEDNFSNHRCQILAAALLATKPSNSSQERLKSIYEYLAAQEIDLDRPYLCFSDEDTYQKLGIE